MRKIVFILGTGHCGSTLIDLLLGSYSKAFSLGEIHRIMNVKPEDKLCDLCEGDCDVWTKHTIQNIQKTYAPHFIQKVKAKLNPDARLEVKFYDEIFKATQSKLIIDSSKNAGWILRNGRALEKSSKYQPILLYLSRDGRAVVNSYFRKYPDRGLETIAHNWNARIKRINECMDKWPNEHKIQIRYKDLAMHPEQTIKYILAKIDGNYEFEMMQFWKHKHHIVNGNAGTKSMLIKFQKQHLHKEWIETNNKAYYEEQELGIKFDERWKRELTIEKIKSIEKIIHKFNSEIIS